MLLNINFNTNVTKRYSYVWGGSQNCCLQLQMLISSVHTSHFMQLRRVRALLDATIIDKGHQQMSLSPFLIPLLCVTDRGRGLPMLADRQRWKGPGKCVFSKIFLWYISPKHIGKAMQPLR